MKSSYDLSSKNYFQFFGVDEKWSISNRQLTTQYKKICTELKSKSDFLSRDQLSFANRAFDTLLNPIERARYLISLHDKDNDIRDNITAYDMYAAKEFRWKLEEITEEDEVDEFILDLKEHSNFIIDQLEINIDEYKNYDVAAGYVSKWYEIQEIYKEAKLKKQKLHDGIVYIPFTHRNN